MKIYASVLVCFVILFSGHSISAEQTADDQGYVGPVPSVVVSGNSGLLEEFHVLLNEDAILNIEWKYTGSTASDSSFRFPKNVEVRNRKVYFYEVHYTNLTDNPITFIEGYATQTTWVGNSNNSWNKLPSKKVIRADLGAAISKYDIPPKTTIIRKDYYVYGPEDGSEPHNENTYIYELEGSGYKFAVRYIQGKVN